MKTRKERKNESKKMLYLLRKEQVDIAISRDSALCVICWFTKNKQVRMDHVHHIYGRATLGRDKTYWREGYRFLMCTCAECHPQPIKLGKGSSKLGWVEELIQKMNGTPINSNFLHTGSDDFNQL